MISHQLVFLVLGLAVAVSAKVQSRRISPRIVGGISIDISSVPYQVSLRRDNWHHCGGSIIHHSWILTAAHCLRMGIANNYTIRAGSTVHYHGGVVVQVSKIIKHPLYEEKGRDNYDAALLKLKTPLKFNQNIKPIPLTETEPKEGNLIVISGWGRLEEQGQFSPVLKTTMVPIFSKDKCKQIFRSMRPITESMFCAGLPEGGKDSCKGDSGGPAVFKKSQVGIVSWGLGCGRKNMPGVYTNVTMIKSWINALIS